MPILLLLLASAPGGVPHHRAGHASIQHWHMRAPDGLSARDFGRRLGHRDSSRDSSEAPRLRRPLENVDVGNGARLGFGFVQGHHLGFKLRSPF